ncbi:MAG: phosphomannomutase/phosphoglucomutase [Myxococcales bacterium]|nr:phosphomannomutase/phosphoglucomutase [Myxococcales bacterium]
MNRSVFRAYDIRGVADRDLTDDFVVDLGRALGTQVRRRSEGVLALGRDCRVHSPRLHQALLSGLLSTGVRVLDVGIVASPLLYFATHHLGCGSGVEITGSHNPASDNGFKILLAGASLHGEALAALHDQIVARDFVCGIGQHQAVDIVAPYLDFVRQRLCLGPRRFRIVIDGGNGTGGAVAVALLRSLGFDVTPLYCEMDGRFPHHPPDPTVPEHLAALKAEVARTDAELGLAFDGDADRLVVVDSRGRILWGDELLILLGRAILQHEPGARFVCEVKCSQAVHDELTAAGGQVLMWRVGHSELRTKMQEIGAALAGEMSGHLFFAHRYLGYDDAIYAAARLIELLSDDPRPQALAAQVDTLPRLHRTPEIRIPVADAAKEALVQHAAAMLRRTPGVEISELDGIRIHWPDAWALLRASNTQAALVLRFEATHAKRLSEVRTQVERVLMQSQAALSLTPSPLTPSDEPKR